MTGDPHDATVVVPAPAGVDVVLAVWNGAQYLEEFLASLVAQTYPGWRLVVRDNHSIDATPALLDAWGARRPRSYLRISDSLGFLARAAANFSAAMRWAAAPYVMFADADDVWLADKIEVTLQHMRRAEAAAPPGTPVLVHTDLRVVDAEKRTLAASFWDHTHARPTPARTRFRRIAIRNIVTGCTAMANRALLERAWPVPAEAGWHDWWFALVAAGLGQIVAVPRATLLYRQHGSNETGAAAWGPGYWHRRLQGGWSGLHASVRRAQEQAGVLQERFAAQLRPADREWLERFTALPRYGALQRRWRALRCPVASIGWSRTLAWYLVL